MIDCGHGGPPATAAPPAFLVTLAFADTSATGSQLNISPTPQFVSVTVSDVWLWIKLRVDDVVAVLVSDGERVPDLVGLTVLTDVTVLVSDGVGD